MLLFQWFKAVGKQWIADVTGGLAVGLIALYSELTGVTVSPKVYLVVIMLALFQAMFLAWKEQRIETEAEKAEKEKSERRLADPILHGDILLATSSSWEPSSGEAGKTVRLRVRLSIRNTGLVPTIVKDWVLFVPPDTYLFPNTLGLMGMIPYPSDRPERGRRQAIQQGEAAEFELTFKIPFSRAQLKGLICEIQFKDVRNNGHSVQLSGLG